MSGLRSVAVALLGMGGLAVGWAMVQAAWQRTFPERLRDPDALAGRIGCQGCAATTAPCPTGGEAARCLRKERS